MNNAEIEINSIDNKLPMFEQEVDNEFGLLDLLKILLDNLRLLVLGPLAVGGLTLGYSFFITPTFTAKTQFLSPQQQQSTAASMLASLGNFGGLANAVGGIKNPADQYIAYMKSVTLQNELIDKFKLVERYKTNSKTDARVALSGNVRINSGKDGLISVEVDDIDPKFAADLANSYVDELGKLLGRLAVTEAQKRRFFFEKQLILAKEKLIQSEIALKSTGISGTVLKSSPALAITTVASLQAAITSQEVKLGAMHGYFSDTSPDFIQAMRELKNLKSQLERQEKLIPVKMDSKIEDSDYISRYREFKYNETLYELFSKQFEVAKLDEAREGVIVQVLDYAIPPEKKSKPKRAIIAISTTIAVGFLLLIFILITKIIENTKKDANSEKKIVALKSSLLKAFGRI